MMSPTLKVPTGGGGGVAAALRFFGRTSKMECRGGSRGRFFVSAVALVLVAGLAGVGVFRGVSSDRRGAVRKGLGEVEEACEASAGIVGAVCAGGEGGEPGGMAKASEAPKMLGRGGRVTADTLLFEGVVLGLRTADGRGVLCGRWRGSFCGKGRGLRCRRVSKVTFEGGSDGGSGGGGALGLGGNGGVARVSSAEGRVLVIGEEGRGAALVRAEFGEALGGGRGAS